MEMGMKMKMKMTKTSRCTLKLKNDHEIPDLGKENIDIINNLANEGKLKPHICKIFSFEHSLKALKYLKDRKLIGKVVISIS